jgi:uncharacterized protein (DUF2225 family)
MAKSISRQFTCVFCGKEFKDDVSTDAHDSSVQDTDFRVHYLAFQTKLQTLHTCPFCGFTDDFHRDKLEREEREKIQESLYYFCFDKDPRHFTPTQQYELLARIFVLRNRSPVEIAQAFLHAAWLAEDEHNTALGNHFRDCAKKFFITAIETQNVEPGRIPVITYLVGELNRRLGNFTEALEWYAKVKSQDPRLSKLCEHQKFFATVQKSVNTRMPDSP